MIQRIQSFYMLLVSLIMGVVGLFVNIVSYQKAYKLMDLVYSKNFYLILVGIMYFTVSVFALLGLFNFKKRILQKRINTLNIILNILLLGLLFFYLLSLSGDWKQSMKGIGLWFPLLSIVLLIMANRAIQRDENLVKSVDRIR